MFWKEDLLTHLSRLDYPSGKKNPAECFPWFISVLTPSPKRSLHILGLQMAGKENNDTVIMAIPRRGFARLFS